MTNPLPAQWGPGAAGVIEQLAWQEREIERLREACQLALDFHGADTEIFVARYGHGITTRQLCARLRAALERVAQDKPA